MRMEVEIISYQITGLILAIGACWMFQGLWKYLDKKALGMQTLFDLMIKDLIIRTACFVLGSQLVLLKFVKSYNYYLAFILVFNDYGSIWAFFLQIFITVFIRYLSIFHHTWLSALDDLQVVKITRILVTALYFIIPWTVEIPKGVTFIFLTDQDPNLAQTSNANDLRIFVLLELLFIIYVQVKVELYDIGTGPIHHDERNEDEGGFTYSKTTLRFVMALSTITLLAVIFWFFIARGKADDLVLSRLRVQLLVQLVASLIIPIILISRNPNMTKFF